MLREGAFEVAGGGESYRQPTHVPSKTFLEFLDCSGG